MGLTPYLLTISITNKCKGQKLSPDKYSSSILVRPLLQLLTTTTISWNKTEKIGVMILKVYMRINIVLLIVYPQFGKQSLLAPLIMSGVVRVRVSKSFRLRKEFQPPLRTQALQAH